MVLQPDSYQKDWKQKLAQTVYQDASASAYCSMPDVTGFPVFRLEIWGQLIVGERKQQMWALFLVEKQVELAKYKRSTVVEAAKVDTFQMPLGSDNHRQPW